MCLVHQAALVLGHCRAAAARILSGTSASCASLVGLQGTQLLCHALGQIGPLPQISTCIVTAEVG